MAGVNRGDPILLVSSHGGNRAFLDFFAQSMLGKAKDYVVYVTSVLSLKEEQVTSLKERFGDIELTAGWNGDFNRRNKYGRYIFNTGADHQRIGCAFRGSLADEDVW